jgi:NitT/TauT family transport system ATP-binding protein
LTGRLIVSSTAEVRHVPRFLEFFDGAATFPWRSQAAWIAHQIAGRLGLDRKSAIQTAKSVFRSDLYRDNLGDIGAILPGASSKLEGGLPHETAVSAQKGRLVLAPNAFFDGQIFDPG